MHFKKSVNIPFNKMFDPLKTLLDVTIALIHP